MYRLPAQLVSCFLIVLLLLTPLTFAGRRHSDVENIGNRKINGKVAGLFPISFLWKRKFRSARSTPSKSNGRRGWLRILWSMSMSTDLLRTL